MPYHVPEFIQGLHGIPRCAITMVSSKKRNRGIAPVIHLSGRTILRIKLKYRQQFNCRYAQFNQVRNLFNQAGICAAYLVATPEFGCFVNPATCIS